MLIKHKEDCLSINRMQSVDLEEGIPVPCSYAFKVVCIDNRFSETNCCENAAFEFIRAILKEYNYCKK